MERGYFGCLKVISTISDLCYKRCLTPNPSLTYNPYAVTEQMVLLLFQVKGLWEILSTLSVKFSLLDPS